MPKSPRLNMIIKNASIDLFNLINHLILQKGKKISLYLDINLNQESEKFSAQSKETALLL